MGVRVSAPYGCLCNEVIQRYPNVAKLKGVKECGICTVTYYRQSIAGWTEMCGSKVHFDFDFYCDSLHCALESQTYGDAVEIKETKTPYGVLPTRIVVISDLHKKVTIFKFKKL